MASKKKFYLFGLGIIIIFLVILGAAKGLYWPSQKVINNNQPEVITPSAETATSGEEIYTNANGYKWTLPAKADFTVASAPGDRITFLEGKIDPLKVHPGDVQHMRIVVRAVNGIAGVSAEIETDHGTTTLPLKKTGLLSAKDLDPRLAMYVVDTNNKLQILSPAAVLANQEETLKATGSTLGITEALAAGGEQEIWEGDWTVKDTSVRNYITNFVATDNQGNKKSLVLDWSDPCTTNGVTLWPLTGSVSTVANSNPPATCAISSAYGVDNGTLTLNSGGNITLNTGGTLVANSVTIPGGSIIMNGGQFKPGGTLWVLDADNDLYPANSNIYLSSQGAGYVRQYTLASANTDCNDANQYAWRNITSAIDVDHDGYPTSTTGSANCVGAASGSYYKNDASNYNYLAGTSWSAADCNDANANVKPSQVNWWSSAGTGWTPVGDYNCSGVAQYAWAHNFSYTNYTPAQTTESQSSAWTIACSQYTGTQYTASACGTTIGYTGSIFVIASGAFNNSCDTARANSELRYWTAGPLISVCK